MPLRPLNIPNVFQEIALPCTRTQFTAFGGGYNFFLLIVIFLFLTALIKYLFHFITQAHGLVGNLSGEESAAS